MTNRHLQMDIELDIINNLIRLLDMGILDSSQVTNFIMELLWHTKSSVYKNRIESYIRVAEATKENK